MYLVVHTEFDKESTAWLATRDLDLMETNDLSSTTVPDQLVDEDQTTRYNYSGEPNNSACSFALQTNESYGIKNTPITISMANCDNESQDYASESNFALQANESYGSLIPNSSYGCESQDTGAPNFSLQANESYRVVQNSPLQCSFAHVCTGKHVRMAQSQSPRSQSEVTSSCYPVTCGNFGGEHDTPLLGHHIETHSDSSSTSVADQIVQGADQTTYHNYSGESQDSVFNNCVLQTNESYGVVQNSPASPSNSAHSPAAAGEHMRTAQPHEQPQLISESSASSYVSISSETDSPQSYMDANLVYEVVQDVQMSTESICRSVGVQLDQPQPNHNPELTVPHYDHIPQTDSPPPYMDVIRYEVVQDSPLPQVYHDDTTAGYTQQGGPDAHVIATTPGDIETEQSSGRSEEPESPLLVKARCICIAVPLCCISVLGAVSLVLTWMADINYVNYILTIPLGASLIVISFIALPAGICCLCLRRDNNLRSYRLTKVTFYVAVITAVPIAFVGTFTAGLLQIFFITNHSFENRIFDSPVLGGNAASINLFTAVLCIIMVTITIIFCIKDRSRKCSNGCVTAFVFIILLLVSNVSAYILTINSVLLFREFSNNQEPIFVLMAGVLGGGASYFLITGACVVGPIICCQEIHKSIHLVRDSSVFILILSLLNLGNAIAGALMIVASSSISNLNLDPSKELNQRSYATQLLLVGIINLVVTMISVIAFCTGCCRGVVPQIKNINLPQINLNEVT